MSRRGLQDGSDTPSSRRDTPSSRSDTPSSRSDTPSSRSDTPPSRSDTPSSRSDTSPRTIQLVISTVLRTGVFTSLAVILAGLALDLARNPAHRSSGSIAHRLFAPSAPYPHTFGAIFTGVVHGDAVSIMVLGLVILLATPIVNVAVSALTFVHERDARFVAITTFVLVVLIGSFALGKVGG